MSWKKLSSRTVYDNAWMRVREDRVINPGGGENLYGHVHFKNRAAAILPLDDEDHTWLVGQSRYTLGRYSWELPMGGAPRDEKLLAAAKRELKEETGLSADRWEEHMRLHPSNSITDEFGMVYVARELTQGAHDFEETEDLSVRRLPVDEAIELCVNGTISDAITLAALFKLAFKRASSP
ncbi:MAG: NUDIX hydrolase [Pseudomonadota bacterium]